MGTTQSTQAKESFTPSYSFEVKNHLRSPVEIYVTLPSGSSRSLSVPSFSSKMMMSPPPNTKVQVFVDEKLYSSFTITERTDSLHIGQLTTRFNQGDGEANLQAGHSAAAVQGRPHIFIHNLSHLPLTLNDNIVIAPRSKLRYRGRYFNGVPLGMRLTDKDDLYPIVELDKPITDIYYGLTSDVVTPFYGGYEIKMTHRPTMNQAYLFEDGWW